MNEGNPSLPSYCFIVARESTCPARTDIAQRGTPAKSFTYKYSKLYGFNRESSWNVDVLIIHGLINLIMTRSKIFQTLARHLELPSSNKSLPENFHFVWSQGFIHMNQTPISCGKCCFWRGMIETNSKYP